MIRNRTLAGVAIAVILALAPLGPARSQDADPLGAAGARQLYLDGQYDQAFAMVLRLAETGDAQAKVTLGYFYSYGFGTARDEAKAIALFEEAAEQNHPAALFNLAVSYEFGSLGQPKDPARAYALFLQAAALDHPPSLHRLAMLYLLADRLPTPLSALGVPKDPALGRALLERAVAAGHPQATADLAELLHAGVDLPQNLPRARKLYLIAAAHGFGDAQHIYAAMVEAGEGGPADLAEAELWFRRAQGTGVVGAALDLAQLLARNAQPGPDRQVEALAWCLWYDASLPVVVPEDPLRNCTWARTGLGPEDVAAAQALAKTF
jgi:uncharacterized protein